MRDIMPNSVAKKNTIANGLTVTTSDGTKRKLANVTAKQKPRVTRWLYDTWNAQGDDLRIEDIIAARQNGVLSSDVLGRWQKAYSGFVLDMRDAYKKAAVEGGEYVIDNMFKSGYLRKPIPYEAASQSIQAYFAGRANVLYKGLNGTQSRAVNFLIDYYTREVPLTVDELGRVLRACVSLDANSARQLKNIMAGVPRGTKLEKKLYNEMLLKNESRLRARRARRLADYEIKKAYAAAYDDVYAQVKQSATLNPKYAEQCIQVRQWDASPECCPICLLNHGTIIPIDGIYPSGDTGIPAHAECDCSESTGVMTLEQFKKVEQ
jgi:hypothetical protein